MCVKTKNPINLSFSVILPCPDFPNSQIGRNEALPLPLRQLLHCLWWAMQALFIYFYLPAACLEEPHGQELERGSEGH